MQALKFSIIKRDGNLVLMISKRENNYLRAYVKQTVNTATLKR